MTENDHGTPDADEREDATPPENTPPVSETPTPDDVNNTPAAAPSTQEDEAPAPSTPGEEIVAKLVGKENVTMHDVLDALPRGFTNTLSAQDLDALSSGDPEKVAQVLKLHVEASPTPEPTDPPATPPAPTPDPRLPERISLKGVSAKDQQAIMDAVRAVKEGKYATFDEARTALAGTPPANADTPPPTPPAQPETAAAIEARIAELEAQQEKAADEYDTAALLKLNKEISKAYAEKTKAELREAQHQTVAQQWEAEQAKNIKDAETKYADLLADPNGAFSEALMDARLAAEHRQDPLLAQPDWPLKLAERVHQRLYGRPQTPGTKPAKNFPAPPSRTAVPKARGVLEQPSAPAVPAYTTEQALSMVKTMNEADADRLLKAMKAREDARPGARR